MGSLDESKLKLWHGFLASNRVEEDSVPLFATTGGVVSTMAYGRDGRRVLQRSPEMDVRMRSLGKELIGEFETGEVVHDGILYLMFRRDSGSAVPLYFGKAEVFGKQKGRLSVNISDLPSGDGMFGRWGYNYAYHLGDLSAVTLPGHPEDKKTLKYQDWRRALFADRDTEIRIQGDVRFWACLWGPECPSVWRDYGATRLAFEEYLLIGVASDLFPNQLLNREGRNRLEQR